MTVGMGEEEIWRDCYVPRLQSWENGELGDPTRNSGLQAKIDFQRSAKMDFSVKSRVTHILECLYEEAEGNLVNEMVELVLTCKPAPGALDITWRANNSEKKRWIDHPLLLVDEGHLDGDLIDDTRATRALVEELFTLDFSSPTTTRATHVARLVAALSQFWQ